VGSAEAFNSFKKFKSFKPPPLFLPRGAEEDEGGGLNGLNGLNVLNRDGRRDCGIRIQQKLDETA
jgi:hypothetical protein